MAIILPPEQTWRTSIPQALGSINQGAGSVLSALAEQKLQQMAMQQQQEQQQNQQQQLAQQYKTLGLPETLGYLAPNVQASLGKELMAQRQRSQLAEMLTGQPVAPVSSGIQQLAPQIQQQQMMQRPANQLPMQQPKSAPQFDYEGEKARLGALAAYDPRMYQQALSDLNRRQEHAENLALKKQELGLKHAEQKESFLTKKEEKQQQQIDKENASYNKHLDTARPVVERLKPELDRMRNMLETGKVRSGIAGKFIPSYLQNTETQEFDAAANDIVNMLSGELRGPASKFKLENLKKTKPDVSQTPEVQRKRLDYWEKQIGGLEKKMQIREDLIGENGGKQPRQLEALVNKEFKKWEKSGRPQAESNFGQSLEALPAANSVKPGKKFYDDVAKKTYVSDGSTWKVI